MTCYVYVIGTEDGPVKVGMSESPGGRLGTLQTGSAVRLQLLHMRACRSREHAQWHEETFHKVYAEKRLVGEWFDLPAAYAIEGVNTSFEIEEWTEEQMLREYQAAQLNIWQAA